MTQKYAIFIDIDETLRSNGKIHPDNLDAIKKVRNLGHYVFLNTGRALSWVVIPKLVDLNDYDGIISGIGTYILIEGKPFFENFIDNKTLYDIINYLSQTEHCFFISGTKKGFIKNPIPFFENYPFLKITTADEFIKKYSKEKIQKVEMFGNGISDEVKKFLSKYLDVYDHKWYIECCPKNVTKSEAMLKVANKLSVPKEQIIAMGDSVNDIDMLSKAGISVAMGNAIDDVKKIADFVSIPSAEGGVGYALKKLVLNKQQF